MSYNKKTGLYEGYIYKIYNDINNKIYIGQTIRTIRIRWSQYKYDSKNKDISKKCIIHRAMSKYGIENFHIVMIDKYFGLSKDDLIYKLNNAEQKYINEFNCIDPNGYNMIEGGYNSNERSKCPVDAYDASGKLIYSFDSLADASAFVSDNQNHGISQCCMGRTQQALGYIWRYHGDSFNKYSVTITQEVLDRYLKMIEVDQYDLSGKKLNSFKSITDALKSINVNGGSLIQDVCKGMYRQAYGFVWRYKDEAFDKYIFNEPKNKVMVDVYDLNTEELIGVFESATEACRQLGLSEKCHNSIILNCQGQLKSILKKYVCRYHGDQYDKYGNPKEKKKKEQKIIYKYDLDGNWLGSIISARNESIKNHWNGDAILNCCRGIRPNGSHKYKGFLWYYSDDPDQPDKSKIITKEEFRKQQLKVGQQTA